MIWYFNVLRSERSRTGAPFDTQPKIFPMPLCFSRARLSIRGCQSDTVGRSCHGGMNQEKNCLSWKDGVGKTSFRWSKETKQRKSACHGPESGAKREQI
jgi:hypothetical protein